MLRWIAYMLSVAGAVTIAFACFSGAPTSTRKHLARMRKEAAEPEEAVAVVESKPYASALVVLLVAGLLLIAAGTGARAAALALRERRDQRLGDDLQRTPRDLARLTQAGERLVLAQPLLLHQQSLRALDRLARGERFAE